MECVLTYIMQANEQMVMRRILGDPFWLAYSYTFHYVSMLFGLYLPKYLSYNTKSGPVSYEAETNVHFNIDYLFLCIG